MQFSDIQHFLSQPALIEYLKLLSVIIASVGAMHFTRNRWLTEQEKVRLELFERRFKVFEATANLIKTARSRKFNEELGDVRSFQDTPHLARFLFSDEVGEYLDQVWGAVCDIQEAEEELSDAHSPAARACNEVADFKTLRHNKREAVKKSELVFRKLYTVFEPYLSFGAAKAKNK